MEPGAENMTKVMKIQENGQFMAFEIFFLNFYLEPQRLEGTKGHKEIPL
jgi:hypothetical protein